MMTIIKNDDCGLIISKTWHLLYKDAISNYQDLESFEVIRVKKTIDCLFSIEGMQDIKQIHICCGDASRFLEAQIWFRCLSQRNYECVVYLDESLVTAWNHEKSRLNIPLSTVLPQQDEQTLLLDMVRGVHFKKINTEQSRMVKWMNDSRAQIIALDCPSGLDPDTGGIKGQEICHANYTLSYFGYLQGLWTGLGKTYTGKKVAIPNEMATVFKYSSWLMHSAHIRSILPKRPEYAHKGCFKKVKFISGQISMFGATLLAAKAALLMGAGLVEVYHPQNIQIPYAEFPEVIWHPVGCGTQIPFDEHSDSIWVVGPGLGMDAWGLSIWKEISKREFPMVVDASALRWLSRFHTQNKPWIITPHPGEAADLLGLSAAEIQNNRFRAIEQLQHQTQMTVVLKGSGTLVMGKNKDIEICPLGHAGMATPGMGDVLTGMIAGLFSQVSDPVQASVLGVWLHAAAADRIRPIVTASHLLHELQFHLQDVLCT